MPGLDCQDSQDCIHYYIDSVCIYCGIGSSEGFTNFVNLSQKLQKDSETLKDIVERKQQEVTDYIEEAYQRVKAAALGRLGNQDDD